MRKIIDIAGQKFGKLTAIEFAGNGKWDCICECGNHTYVASNKLRKGEIKSCGCLLRERLYSYEDLVGKRFGRLTVISRAENYSSKSNRGLRWNCLCDCGNKCTVGGGALKKGATKSCGCLHEENLKIISQHGSFMENEYETIGNVVYIKVTKSEEKVICDLEDWEYLKKYYWNLNNGGYVVAMADGKLKKMHRMIMKENKGDVIDHINRNKLDNRKENLRYTTYKINAQNRSPMSNNKSGHVGVYKVKNGWHAWIGADYRRIHLGSFKTKEEAVRAREEAEKMYHSEK